MNRKNITNTILLLLLLLSACGQPNNGQAEPTSGPDLALTITAQAALLDSLTQTALAPTATPESTATAILSPTPEFTATPSKVFVTVSANTNCRSGPGSEYSIEGALTVGQQAEVIGKNSTTNYWIIKNPNGGGNCWLWGEHATVNGNAAGLQEVEVPPTVTPLAALAPVIDHVVVRPDASSGGLIIYLDVYFFDGEGDANLADFQLISASINTSGTIKDVPIAPSANQKRGGVVTGQWSCGTKQYDIAVGVTLRDQAGHVSNSMSVNFSCNKK
ncbi:MAG: hypothetical protein DCC56_12615 [Anaerolineae bacterium]|nr:MAG: hypothetical protein DCC56_12615 [Anaerolineae bacterium]WKZ43045.1 MAG: hypothetical protein QY302_13165 [Anaerolineales bacterium]